MATETFAVGDVVHLKSNPEVKMTVKFVLGAEIDGKLGAAERMSATTLRRKSEDIICEWLDSSGKKQSDSFKSALLTKH